MQWDKPMDGRLWYFDSNSEEMWFDSKEKDDQAGQKRPYSAWLEMGWGLFPVPEEKEEDYKTLQAKGARRYAEMMKKLESGKALRLPQEVAEARTAYFQKYYKTEPKKGSDEYSADITSSFKHLPPGMDRSKQRDTGFYQNRLSLKHGQFVANMNYALPGGERYYNPASGEAEKLSNSEIIFQQWKQAAENLGSDKGLPSLQYLQRCAISGEGLVPLNTILKANGYDEEKLGNGVKFDAGTEAFKDLLAVPNITAAIWLVLDHGEELGIRGIKSITVDSAKNATIEFIQSGGKKSE